MNKQTLGLTDVSNLDTQEISEEDQLKAVKISKLIKMLIRGEATLTRILEIARINGIENDLKEIIEF